MSDKPLITSAELAARLHVSRRTIQNWVRAGCPHLALAANVKRSLPVRLRFSVLARDKFRCVYCGDGPPDARLEVDHVKPRSAGGKDTPENLVTACLRCNRGKCAMDVAPNTSTGHGPVARLRASHDGGRVKR